MNKTNLRLYAAFAFTLILMSHAINAESNPISDNNLMYAMLPTNYEMEALKNIGIGLTGIGILAAYQYIVTNYLVQQEHLVVTDYPFAQLWYNELAHKYPTAHLESKLFLQTMRGVPAKNISWCSSFNHIYFPHDALSLIDYYYENKINNDRWSEEEQESELFLAQQEFILLHEAGHIEHKDATKRFTALAYASVAGQGLEYGFQKMSQNTTTSYKNITDYENAFAAASFNESCSWCCKAMTIFAGYMFIVRKQEHAADDFACKTADLAALKGGIHFFETHKEADLLIDIENKTVSPFIKVKDSWGQKIQDYVAARDEQELKDMQAIQQNPDARWIFDFCVCMTHPGSSARVKKIQNEIDRRLERE